MKTVFPSSEVPHLWAHKTQEHARNSRGNVHFCGGTMYSYGAVIAQHVENKRGEKAVLITTGLWSPTTSCHTSAARGAVSHLTVFHVHRPGDDDRRAQFEEYRARVKLLMGEYGRAKSTRPRRFQALMGLIGEANDFAEFFGLRCRLKEPENAEAIGAECARLEKQTRILQQRKKAKARRAHQEHADKWVAGESDYIPHSQIGAEDPIRLRIRGKDVQTSLGARIPIADAKRAYRILHKLRARGKVYKRNGGTISIGGFTLDSLDSKGAVKVGCHTIEWSEIERVAKLGGEDV